jgi:ABC-type lipoprotein export system ATPase subunit
MVTHEPEYAEIADRIIEMQDGNIISDKLVKKTNNFHYTAVELKNV